MQVSCELSWNIVCIHIVNLLNKPPFIFPRFTHKGWIGGTELRVIRRVSLTHVYEKNGTFVECVVKIDI